jgi:ribosomal protein L11 methyltransferase
MRRLVVSVPLARAEEARAVMVDLFPSGFEERDDAGVLELAAYTESADAARRLDRLGPVCELEVVAGWEDEWRKFHRPVRVGPLWIGPSWEPPDADAVAIVVDPGRAFGTGAHATTRLCLELLLELEPTGVVDLGCGSGVLAVAAAKLGFAPVVALDTDEAAVEAARRNATANGADVDVRVSDVLADPLPAVEAAVANMAREPVERAAERFSGSMVVASGYLENEQPSAEGWRVADRRLAEGWAADLLVRAPGRSRPVS